MAGVLLGAGRAGKSHLSRGELFRLPVLSFCLFALQGVQPGVVVSVRGGKIRMDNDLCFHLVEVGWRVAFPGFILLSKRGKINKCKVKYMKSR